MGLTQSEYDIKSILPTLPLEFLSKNGKIKKEEALNNDIVGIYFSAHWCGPCRSFTPNLGKFYENANKEKKQIEIIYCPSDQTQNEFDDYYKTMPWLAIPFESESKDAIADGLGISSIPTLIIFDKNGNVLDNDGRITVEKRGFKAIQIWQENLQKTQNQ